MKRILLLGVLLLSGCGQDGFDDLKVFMDEAGKGRQPALEPMPPIKPVETTVFDAAALPDPFILRSMKSARGGGGRQPDMNRPRGPLENFPLDALKMVGTLSKGGQTYALIRTPENALYRVRKGDYLGQNFGLVTAITQTGVELVESIQDGSGDWVDSKASVALQE